MDSNNHAIHCEHHLQWRELADRQKQRIAELETALAREKIDRQAVKLIEARAALKVAEENRIEAIAHLRCALVQSSSLDDQIILEHIRSAVTELERSRV